MQPFRLLGSQSCPLLFENRKPVLMDPTSPSVSPEPAERSGIDAETASLLHGMTTEQVDLTIGLGLLVQRAAEVEYILHGIYAHLGNAEKPYADKPTGSVTDIYIKRSLTRLAGVPLEQIPPHARKALIHDLELCRRSFELRNLFVHGCWNYDDDARTWRVIKGEKPDQVIFPLIHSEEVHDLATEFARLNHKLVAWDAHFYGTPGDPDSGEAAVSSTRLR